MRQQNLAKFNDVLLNHKKLNEIQSQTKPEAV